MKLEVRYVFIFTILIFSMLNFVSAVPPVTTVQSFPEGLDIQVHPIKQYFKIGEDMEFHIHVFNSTTGYPINESLLCSFHLYNTTGNHLFTGVTSSTEEMYDYEIIILGGNFTSNTKSYHAFCYNGGIGGDYSYAIQGTLSGYPPSIITIIAYIVLLISVLGAMSLISSVHGKTDFKQKEKLLVDNHKNMGETLVKGILIGIFKNSFIWMYFIGWILILIIREILYEFSQEVVYGYFVLMTNIYSLGLLLVTVYMIGYTISYMRNIFSILTDNDWGVRE